MTQYEVELRKWALQLACTGTSPHPCRVEVAEKFYEFVTGKSDDAALGRAVLGLIAKDQ